VRIRARHDHQKHTDVFIGVGVIMCVAVPPNLDTPSHRRDSGGGLILDLATPLPKATPSDLPPPLPDVPVTLAKPSQR
jgi:hypothetical protein